VLTYSQYSNDDVVQTMFAQGSTGNTSGTTPDTRAVKPSETSKIKVNDICDAFLVVLSNKTSRIQNTITAHVCKQPPDLDSALLLIAKLRGKICYMNAFYETTTDIIKNKMLKLPRKRSSMSAFCVM